MLMTSSVEHSGVRKEAVTHCLTRKVQFTYKIETTSPTTNYHLALRVASTWKDGLGQLSSL